MIRWIGFILVVLVGIVAGLFYGWVVNPVKYVDITPASLRVDYQTDYVLMVAEAYQADGDLALAVRRLAVLGDSPPVEIVRQAMIFAVQAPYADSDQKILSQLAIALQAWNPVQEAP